MKHTIDGNQVCVTRDDFVDLQHSPAVFVPLKSGTGRTIVEHGFGWLSVGELEALLLDLARGTALRREEER